MFISFLKSVDLTTQKTCFSGTLLAFLAGADFEYPDYPFIKFKLYENDIIWFFSYIKHLFL